MCRSMGCKHYANDVQCKMGLTSLHDSLARVIAFLRSSKNAFIMQSKSTFLEFLRCIYRYKFGPPKIFFRGEII